MGCGASVDKSKKALPEPKPSEAPESRPSGNMQQGSWKVKHIPPGGSTSTTGTTTTTSTTCSTKSSAQSSDPDADFWNDEPADKVVSSTADVSQPANTADVPQPANTSAADDEAAKAAAAVRIQAVARGKAARKLDKCKDSAAHRAHEEAEKRILEKKHAHAHDVAMKSAAAGIHVPLAESASLEAQGVVAHNHLEEMEAAKRLAQLEEEKLWMNAGKRGGWVKEGDEEAARQEKAATAIQAAARGKQARKNVDAKKLVYVPENPDTVYKPPPSRGRQF
eukprot:gnl/TRDRNA2_/TRDRNA2_28789_c0_seq1.p1 gnl/TRDRNA2_/TRDRNA2_28789_c0~~gnl/TRDRNA2_/TRDRNA2_28789_c0_seq1.p1  ORF type:complete len:279 (-),score=65.04 gnl/TRDRNA2_/TRDRNA2_28789_c0_seq1:64-900(-)